MTPFSFLLSISCVSLICLQVVTAAGNNGTQMSGEPFRFASVRYPLSTPATLLVDDDCDPEASSECCFHTYPGPSYPSTENTYLMVTVNGASEDLIDKAHLVVDKDDTLIWTLHWDDNYNGYCPGCIVQNYFGIDDYFPRPCASYAPKSSGWEGNLVQQNIRNFPRNCNPLRRRSSLDYSCNQVNTGGGSVVGSFYVRGPTVAPTAVPTAVAVEVSFSDSPIHLYTPTQIHSVSSSTIPYTPLIHLSLVQRVSILPASVRSADQAASQLKEIQSAPYAQKVPSPLRQVLQSVQHAQTDITP
jgi:hypothetical protein